MLTHPTLNQLQELKLTGMAEAFVDLAESPQAKELSHAEWLALLLDREGSTRTNKRFSRLLRSARLREDQAAVEDLDSKAPRKLDKVLFRELATCRWIKESRNLIITGPCGIGKTWLACALGQKACREDMPTIYKRVPRLFEELELGHGDGRFPRMFRALTKAKLLILDDWGPDKLNDQQRRDLMEIVEDRYETGSIIITSQLPVDTWHDIIGEPTLADAILDRIVHNAHRLELDGESIRKTKLAKVKKEEQAACAS
ncbi:MAG: IS21-like element helper ATPase IstB [Hyphomicrobiaceae bacterium]|jgi:DNA replication protein DnaC|nr:IS21-like element helper ATPase IstB [Hyphomicrobiaceae bacterium]